MNNKNNTKEKMWAGRSAAATDKIADDFNSSIAFDSKMFRQDIRGSIAHASMLGATGIISEEESLTIIENLSKIGDDIENGVLEFDLECEDIHMFVEEELTSRIGTLGKKLHTARSRNDQVAVDLRLYMRDETDKIKKLLKGLLAALLNKANKYKSTIMPGYTHLQRAQPVTFGYHLLSYAMMFMRDIERLSDAVARMNLSPLGSCALAGTTYNTDRMYCAKLLGFDGITRNAMDGVSDRDYCLELMSAYSIIMMHLSRFSEEIILWCSWEFKFIELDDAYTTGSSIMPQKKNPDMAELVRGKTGRVYGDLFSLFTTLKGIPLAYNKDMQEDKEAIFDSAKTVIKCLEVFIPMIETMTALEANMEKAAKEGFINATDLADYLTKKGMPFRAAYKITGQIVALCIAKGLLLETLPLAEYKKHSELFEEDLYAEIDLTACVEKRISEGGCGSKSVDAQLFFLKNYLDTALID